MREIVRERAPRVWLHSRGPRQGRPVSTGGPFTGLRQGPVPWSDRGQPPDWRRVADVLLDFMAAVNAGRSLDDFLDDLLARAGQLLGCDAGAVYLPDRQAPELLSVQASHGLPAEAVQAKPRIGQPIVGLAVASRRPVLIADFPAALDRSPASTVEAQIVERGSCLEVIRPGPRSAGDPVQQGRLRNVASHFRSIVAVPLLTSQDAVGSLALYYAERWSPGAEDMYLIGAFADCAALAIENARLRLQSEQHREEVEARQRVAEGMRDLVAVINSTQKLDEVLDAALAQALRLLGGDAGGIYLREGGESSDLLTARAARGLEPEQLAARIRVGSPVTGLCVQERRPVVAFDIEATIADDIRDRLGTEVDDRGTYVQVLRMGGRLDPDLEDAGPPRVRSLVREYRAVVAAPLITRDETHGALSLYYREPREFHPEDIELAKAVADQTALAIENARLYERSQQAAALEERQRLARELHDAVTQTLFSASLIADVLPRLWERSPDEARRRVGELRQLTRGALAEMRGLLLELRPGALTEVGLSELLSQLVQATAGRTPAPLTLQVEGAAHDLPGEVQVGLYRLAQEALANVVKHARPTHASVVVQWNAEGLALSIEDDGGGFDPGIASPGHLGLSIMRERAQAIGAKLAVDSRIGAGTRVRVRWPATRGHE